MRRVIVPFGSGRQAAASGSGLLVGGQGCLVYVELEESTGNASASVTVYDGTGADGLQILDYSVSAAQSTSEQWVLHVMPFRTGLYLANVSGTVVGSLTAWVDYDPELALRREHRLTELRVIELEAALAGQLG